MTETVLLNNGYRQFEVPLFNKCDKFYQKKAGEKARFNVYYYDKFKDNGALDYDFEYEYVEERDNYWYKTYIWGIDYPYTIEEIEEILLGERK